jgi:hypothetical protein
MAENLGMRVKIDQPHPKFITIRLSNDMGTCSLQGKHGGSIEWRVKSYA